MFMIYGLLTKSEVKMAGYWQSFFACLWTETNCVKNTPLRVVFPTLFSVCEYRDETLSLVFDTLHPSPNVQQETP